MGQMVSLTIEAYHLGAWNVLRHLRDYVMVNNINIQQHLTALRIMGVSPYYTLNDEVEMFKNL